MGPSYSKMTKEDFKMSGHDPLRKEMFIQDT